MSNEQNLILDDIDVDTDEGLVKLVSYKNIQRDMKAINDVNEDYQVLKLLYLLKIFL